MKRLLISCILLICSYSICFDGEDEVKIKKMIEIYPLMKSNMLSMEDDMAIMYWMNSNCENALIQVDIKREKAETSNKILGALSGVLGILLIIFIIL